MYAHFPSQWKILNISVPKVKCSWEIPTGFERESGDYSSSVLQLFNGETQGRVEMAQFRMCIIYWYLVSTTLDLTISLRFNDIDVMIVATTGFTGTRGTCHVFVFKETALTGFQDIPPSTRSIFSNWISSPKGLFSK